MAATELVVQVDLSVFMGFAYEYDSARRDKGSGFSFSQEEADGLPIAFPLFGVSVEVGINPRRLEHIQYRPS